MLILAVLVPILIWGFFSPSTAAVLHLSVVGLFEAYLLWDWRFNAFVLEDSTQRPDGRQKMLMRYHQFFKNPVAATGLSSMCSAISLVSIPWALLLLWHRSWALAFLIGLTYYLATVLASVLNPLSSLEHAAVRNPGAGLQLAVVRSLYEEMREIDAKEG